MILGLRSWEICNQDGLSLVPSPCACAFACVHACACLRVCVRVRVYNGPELWALLTPYKAPRSGASRNQETGLFHLGRSVQLGTNVLHSPALCSPCTPYRLGSFASSFHQVLQEVDFHPEENVQSLMSHTHTHIYTYIYIYIHIKHAKDRQKLILEENVTEEQEEVSHSSIKVWSKLIRKSIKQTINER